MSGDRAFRADLAAGARATAPLLPGAASIGLITGLAAASIGFDLGQGLALSVLVFSPVVELTAFRTLEVGAPLALVVLAALVAGARFSVLSLSLSPYVERLSTRWKWTVAYFLVTPAYVLSVERFEADPGTDRAAYYFGVSLPGWATIHGAFLVGFLFGARVPATWHLGFVLPLAFIALLVRHLADRAGLAVALVSGVAAVAGAGLPLGTGLLVAIVAGVGVGFAAGRWEVA